MFGLDKVTVS